MISEEVDKVQMYMAFPFVYLFVPGYDLGAGVEEVGDVADRVLDALLLLDPLPRNLCRQPQVRRGAKEDGHHSRGDGLGAVLHRLPADLDQVDAVVEGYGAAEDEGRDLSHAEAGERDAVLGRFRIHVVQPLDSREARDDDCRLAEPRLGQPNVVRRQ